MVDLDDPRAFKRAMREVVSETAKEEIEEAVEYAVEEANSILRDAAQDPPEGASMEEWSMESIAESVTIEWQPSEPSPGKLDKGDALVASWDHPHANKIEVGVRPHEIQGDPVLVFPWPDAPDGVQDRFRPRWNNPDDWLEEPQVVFAEVDHPGIPALQYIQTGFRRALREFFR